MPLWMVIVEWSARIILVGLIILSIWSVSIILERRKFFKLLDLEVEFNEIKSLLKQYKGHDPDRIISRRIFFLQKSFQKGLSVLGTLGSTTPFIGLLGTILGIIVAFGELSQGGAGTNAIMFALAEALILTAVGLFVAIPAVIAFNIFNKKIKILLNDLKSQIDEFSIKAP